MTKKLKCLLQHRISSLEIGSFNQLSDESIRFRMLHPEQHRHRLHLFCERRVVKKGVDCQEWLEIRVLDRRTWSFVGSDRDRCGRSFEMKERMNERRSGVYLSDVALREQRDFV